MLERIFGIRSQGSTVGTEVVAGVTTFITTCYIIFVQPALLSQAGMDFGAVMAATCLSAAAATLIMGLWANYPVVLAPAMGENFFFVYSIVLAMGVSWEKALGMVMMSGLMFILFSLFSIREYFLRAVSADIRYGITAGIGSLVLVIGLVHAGVLVRDNQAWTAFFSAEAVASAFQGDPGALLGLFDIFPFASNWGLSQVAALTGLFVCIVLMVRKVRGALLIGMGAAGAVAVAAGLVQWQGLVSSPPSLAPTFWKFDLSGLFTWQLFPLVLLFLFMDLFDTIGTLIGVSSQAGLLDSNGELPRARRAFLADAAGTTVGAALGTSTITSFIESAAGVQAGGRTGMTAVVSALLFIAALFFYPLVQMVGSGVEVASGVYLYPITAPALIVVGAIMLRALGKVNRGNWPAFVSSVLIVIGIPASYSIADGLAFGFISYPLLHIISGRARQVSWLMYLLGTIFLLRYIFL